MSDKKSIQINLTNLVQILRYLKTEEKLSKEEVINLIQSAFMIVFEDNKDAA